MNSADYNFKQFDTGRPFRLQLLSIDIPPVPLDITGHTPFLDIREQDAPDSSVRSLPMQIVDGPLGIVERTFDSIDVAKYGWFQAEVRLMTPSNKPITFPTPGKITILIERSERLA